MAARKPQQQQPETTPGGQGGSAGGQSEGGEPQGEVHGGLRLVKAEGERVGRLVGEAMIRILQPGDYRLRVHGPTDDLAADELPSGVSLLDGDRVNGYATLVLNGPLPDETAASN